MRYIFLTLYLSHFISVVAQTNFDSEDYHNRPIAYKFINATARVYPAKAINSSYPKYNNIDSIKYKVVGKCETCKHFVITGKSKVFGEETYHLIRFWEKGDIKKSPKNDPDTVSQSDNGTYFYVSENDFATQSVERYSVKPILEIGVASIPFRYRFGNRSLNRTPDIEFTAISTLPTFSIKWRTDKYNKQSFWGLLAGFGLTTSTIDSSSFPFSAANRDEYKTPKNIATLTGMIGSFIQLRKGQVVIGLGKEFVRKDLKDWAYKKSLYFTIGIGTPLFSIGGKTNNNDDEKKP